jgi:hypothetical protein
MAWITDDKAFQPSFPRRAPQQRSWSSGNPFCFSILHGKIKMDSGFRRNDEQKKQLQ